MKQISIETLQKLLKPFVDKSRNYCSVFKISDGALLFTNGYFLLSIKNPYTKSFADGVYELLTGRPSQVSYPNTANVTPICDKEIGILLMITVAGLVKPDNKVYPIIDLSGRIFKSGEGYNLSYIRLAIALGLNEAKTDEQEDCLLFRSEDASLLLLKTKGE
jgi:hypothetical protein